MANKQTSIVLRKNYNLCEINHEYPLLIKESVIPQDLSIGGKVVKSCQCGHTHQLPKIATTEHQGKVHEQTEVFFNNPEDEKSIHKGRYRRNYIHNDDDQRNNTD